MAKPIFSVEKLRKTTLKTLRNKYAKICSKNTKSNNMCKKSFYSPTFSSFFTYFSTNLSPQFFSNFFHYSTTPTTTTIINIK